MPDLRKRFEGYGDIVDVYIPRDSGGVIGYAFVTFTSRESVEKAFRAEIGKGDVRKASSPDLPNEEAEEGSDKQSNVHESNLLCIKNISRDADVETLKATFAMFGTVVSFRLVQLKNSPVRIGFLEYEHLNVAKELYKAGNLRLIQSFKIEYNKKRRQE